MLLGSLSAETVRWSQALDTLHASKSGEIELVFKDGTVDCFDLVVGADGAWSRVRPFLSPAQPRYTGLTFFELEIRHIERRHPGVAMLVSHGLLIAGADRKTIFAQRNSSGHVRVYVALRCDAIDAAMDDRRSMVAPQTRQQLARQFDGWNAGLVELIEVAEDDVRPWPIHILPVGHQWPTGVGVTLLGDAAHLMAPAGDGANLAMRDAVDLASAIADAEDWRRGIVAYEVGMHSRRRSPRGTPCASWSRAPWRTTSISSSRRCRTNDRTVRAQAVPPIVKLTSAA